MLLGSLIDAGAPVERVRSAVGALKLPAWSLDVGTTTRRGLRGTRVAVTVTESQPARPYAHVRALVETASLEVAVRRRALRTFEVLAAAEARVHGVSVGDVHLHEAGATDALIDIVGTCAALESLRPDKVVASPVATGFGAVDTAHGPLPVPAPAVVEILRGVTVFGRGGHELVTPTGAALLVANCDDFGTLPPMRIEACGYGAGRNELEWPNVVRVLVGDAGRTDEAVVIEANLDDMNPELLPDVIELLLAAGAQDAWVIPVIMKKGRSAFILSALVSASIRDQAIDIIFRETTTLGLRVQSVEKHELHREWIEVQVGDHPVRVKIARRAGEVVTAAPEHDDARRAARATSRPLKDVYADALAAARRQMATRESR